jgi:hypothetical protein
MLARLYEEGLCIMKYLWVFWVLNVSLILGALAHENKRGGFLTAL